MRRRWIVAGQLGPLFDDGGPLLLIESRHVFGRRRMHRARAHLYLSALRHRAATLGPESEFFQVDRFSEIVDDRDDLEMIAPPSYRARRMAKRRGIPLLPSRGFVTEEEQFARFADGRERLVMEDFYRSVRARTGILMQGDQPAGGRWNFDRENRQPPPKGAVTLGIPEPWWPEEDDIDREVRADLDRWQRDGLVDLVGEDGPRRFAVTADEAEYALTAFVESRLADFGPFEDAILANDWTMAHSLLSVPMNLGVLDPRHVIDTVVAEYEAGNAPITSVEGIVRQIAGWRDWIWHLYWHFGEGYARTENVLDARAPLPQAFAELDADAIEAACLHTAIGGVSRHGWAHHIQRLMVIGNWALQRGYDPALMNEWFISMFVDGTDWVMPANVVGMSLHADGGRVATKPYAAGGAYINRMSDHCGGCRFDPTVRLGENACPYTAGYWAFLDRHETRFARNNRMAQPIAGLRRLADRDEVVAQERQRDPLS